MKTKVCSKCKKKKSETKFYKNTQTPSGLCSWCKSCTKEYKKTPKRREYQHKYFRKYYAEHKEQYKNYTNKNRYGFTTEERESLIASKDNKCECCGAKEIDEKRGLFIDHNHQTGKVRGVLCNTCNGAAGLLYDDSDLAYSLFKYLERTGNERK